MGDSPPAAEPASRGRWRWPRLDPDPRAMVGLGLCGLAWAVAIAPQPQPLEGVLKVSALSFVLQPPATAAAGAAQGLLALPVRGLTIQGLAEGHPLVVPLRGTRWNLNGGSALSMSASPTDPLEARISVPPGTRIKNLQAEGQDQLVLDLLPPRSRGGQQPAAELTIIPPAGGNAKALRAIVEEPGSAARSFQPPDSQFSLPLAGATRLRLQRANPKRAVVFENNLLVKDVQFTSERQSLFDQMPITRSTLRSGSLHLGLQEPVQLRPDQFLRIDPPGISVITSLRTDQEQLAVELVGETHRLRSGLSFQHPSSEQQGTLLTRWLTPAQIGGFFGFLFGVMSSLLLTLIKGK